MSVTVSDGPVDLTLNKEDDEQSAALSSFDLCEVIIKEEPVEENIGDEQVPVKEENEIHIYDVADPADPDRSSNSVTEEYVFLKKSPEEEDVTDPLYIGEHEGGASEDATLGDDGCDGSPKKSLQVVPLESLSENRFHISENSATESHSSEEPDHIMAHHTDDPLQCSHCEFKADSRSGLRIHMTARHREKNHKCPYCDYRSIRPRTLREHMMAVHTGEKPHQCPQCDFKTVRSGNLKRHLMAHHSEEKPHHCPHCDYKSVRPGTLKEHMMTVHTGEKPHHCYQCDYKTARAGDLRMHVLARHAGHKPHECPYCYYKSVLPGTLKKHIMTLHTGENAKYARL